MIDVLCIMIFSSLGAFIIEYFEFFLTNKLAVDIRKRGYSDTEYYNYEY